MTLNKKKMIGNRIKELRARKDLTQEQLAEKISINPKYLSSIERGQENPTLDVFIRIAKALDVDIEDIFNHLEVEDPAKRLPAINALLNHASEEQLKTVLKILLATLR
jgi:transcriptional regulator with XRE-family HTH domain